MSENNQESGGVVVNATVTAARRRRKADTQMVRKQSELPGKVEVFIKGNKTAVTPPISPKILLKIPQHNSVLLQCIEAMEVNIDGTGHDFIPYQEGAAVNKNELQTATDFFNEPFPGEHFVSWRRKYRRFLEGTGNVYIEIIRNLKNDMVAIRVLDPQYMRLGPLSDVVPVKRTVNRGGKELEIEYLDRERSYIYSENGASPTYFIAWGSTQQINKVTGEFIAGGLNVQQRGGDIIHITMNDDVETDYGVPRWINQLPSALGSRKAEEQNLDFFDAGGIPSAIIFVKGGTIAGTASDTLHAYLSGGKNIKNTAIVVEATTTGGSIDKPGDVEIQVERFGSEAVNDSMYREYNKECQENLRLSFRLPPLFLGKAADYNYATAVVAYQVAEAQVFKPERDDFDALVNRIIKKELGLKTLKFKSKPITLRDVNTQLKAINMLLPVIKPDVVVSEVNSLCNVNMEFVEGKEFLQPTKSDNPLAIGGFSSTDNQQQSQKVSKSGKVNTLELLDFATLFAKATGLIPSDDVFTAEQEVEIRKRAELLNGEDMDALNQVLSIFVYGNSNLMPLGAIQ